MDTGVKPYKKDLQAVIAASWFTVDEETYVYASVTEITAPQKHLMVVREEKEITVVTNQSHLPLTCCIQVNKERWKLITIRCGNPFYCVGFVASITEALANAGIDIVIISSFSNDLILVMENDLQEAVAVLKEIGFRQAA